MRRSRLSAIFAGALLVVLLGGPFDHLDHLRYAAPDILGQAQAFAQSNGFLFTFDGTPSSPQPWQPTTWDIQTYNNASDGLYTAVPVAAEHGADCSAPPATHNVSAYADAVFLCNGHVMTSIDGGLAAIFLTPNQQVDFSAGEAVISFDISTDMHSNRDWFNVRITPYGEDHVLGELSQGPPRRSLHCYNVWATIRCDAGANFSESTIPWNSDAQWTTFLTPSASRRDRFEFHISRTHIKVGMPAYNFWWYDKDIADLGWTRGVVQFSDQAYSPGKGCVRYDASVQSFVSIDGIGVCPNTWHWDNLQISPALPFTIVRANRRYADAANPAVTLAAPAPTGAFLRFAGSGTNLELSTNGGTTWQPATVQSAPSNDPTTWRSYWTSIPAGTTSVRFRGQNDGYAWSAAGISAFSLTTSGSPPTATSTPTRTPTLAVATSTPTRTPTLAAATSTPTRTPTPTSTPVPACSGLQITAINPASPQPINKDVTVVSSAIAKTGTICEYQFEKRDPGSTTWVVARAWSTSASATYTPLGSIAGTYEIRVSVRPQGNQNPTGQVQTSYVMQ